MKKIKWFVVLGVVLLGFGYLFYKNKTSYEVVNPKIGSIEEAVYGLGTVQSAKVYEYKTGVINTIHKIYKKLGDKVNRGDLVLSFQEGQSFVSPIQGTVTLLPFHEGENVFPQIPIVRIEDLTDRYIEVTLEQLGALRVKSGQRAVLSFENLRNQSVVGEVSTLYPASGQFIVRIKTNELPSAILPGMTVDVAIEVSKRSQVLMIPVKSIISGKITLLENGSRRKIDTKLGVSDGEWIELLEPQLEINTQLLVPRK